MKGRSLFSRSTIPDTLPVLPLRGAVLFPLTVVPIVVAEERSMKLVDDAMRSHRTVAVFARRSDSGEVEEAPVGLSDIFWVGTAATIHQLLRTPNGELRLILQGLERIRLVDLLRTDPYLIARVTEAPETGIAGLQVEALSRTIRGLFQQLLALTTETPGEITATLDLLTDPRQVAYQISALVPFPLAERQALLEIDSVEAKLTRLIDLLQHEIAVRELQRKITSDTREQITKDQREHILREQIRSIQRELGGGEEAEHAEVRELREQLERAELPAEARKEAEREMSRLERTPPISPEHGLIRTYLEWLAALPWNRTTGEQLDVARAREVLDADHYDLEKVKERILEHLAVMKLRRERLAQAEEKGAGEGLKEPILCLVGSPGVGKTSLGMSIARALGRKFVRISLGGIHDEAEVRGHRRTYIGAMPGRLIQALRRAETADPVFMLDEVDKLGVGFHGDPSAALLEVLDPAQNHAFVDTYLGVPFDLSRVLFICTANAVDPIPPALLDRMELLRLPGYTEEEKLQIARRFLVPRLLAAHGLAPDEISIDEAVVRRIVGEYTREAGVRDLERRLAEILRKVARRIVEGAQPPIRVGAEQVQELLGRPPYFQDVTERIDRPGVATGLAWTPVGGDILFVEAALMPAREERLILTGMLGDVMRESAQAALSYLRSNARQLGLDPRAFESRQVHIHVPAGAIPKDGPSAGVAMAAALASVASGRVVRNDVALTGEISLRGKVLPVGGIKEKVLAAHRAGVKTVVLPLRNEDALAELPEEVRRALIFKPVESVDDVLRVALVPEVERVWREPPLSEVPAPMH